MVEVNSDVNDVSEFAFDSQGTISDNEMLSNSCFGHTSENKAGEETVVLSASFLVVNDLEITKSHSESSISNVYHSDSDLDFFSSPPYVISKKEVYLQKEIRGI